MKKDNSPGNRQKGAVTIGMDLGDRSSRWCWLDAEGKITGEGSVATTKRGLQQKFATLKRCRIAIEVGTQGMPGKS